MKMGKDGEPENVGQLLDDLGNFINNGYSGYRWAFTQDVLPNSRALDKLPDENSLEEYNYNIYDYLKKEIDDKKLTYLMKRGGVNPDDIGDSKLRKSFKNRLLKKA
ncbi:hypothetical protein MHM93_19270 [Pseudoalteromonas sp. MM17-2]|uniref:hypothetical protein n=1 Tax=Pseudoalteromonas sp. MM17-2 TaxID=2917753 RepID=UPI001EF68FB4|nr:hypothetical protein [Pseudoalteromonas sp. MM17-2]MCG7546311.1 hypothetical protein [Pseudoalteromonas sp. MM17-2]